MGTLWRAGIGLQVHRRRVQRAGLLIGTRARPGWPRRARLWGLGSATPRSLAMESWGRLALVQPCVKRGESCNLVSIERADLREQGR